ncbi:alanine dehydrogenase [Candidatus Woesearchaeota archaeon]|nr:alanine dehydrogenase [Candidatus Woesearchaeota archaeon]
MTTVATLKEVKDQENRVGLTPSGVKELASAGHRVIVQKGSGEGSGFSDEAYSQAGAEIWEDVPAIARAADIIIKVKEPVPDEYGWLADFKGKTLFTYLHLAAAEKALTETMLRNEITAIAYETVEGKDVRLPLLAPMSEVAGVLAVQYGAQYLQKKYGGMGITLGSIRNTDPATVLVVGGGTVGATAARTAAGLGCKVVLVEKNPDRIKQLQDDFNEFFGEHLFHHISFTGPERIADVVSSADVLVGAVLVVGAKAPRVVTEEMVKTMKHGAIVVDVAIDQGGCVWGSRPTTHTAPIYALEGKIYCCVTNMPGQVSHQATQALTAATLPYLLKLAESVDGALDADQGLRKGVNVQGGKIRCRPVAEHLDMMDLYEAL